MTPVEKKNIRVVLAHITFWLLFMASPLYLNTGLFGFPIALVRTIIPISAIAIIAYANNLFVIRQLFRRKGFAWHTPFIAYTLITPIAFLFIQYAFVFVNIITNVDVSIVFELKQNGEIINTNRSASNFPSSVIGLITILILFISSLYGLALEFIQLDRQEIKLKAANLKNELKLLRRQINPHFLFNAMNNLYAIVQLKPEKAGEFVLKLSEMLRYVTYDCQNDKVSISKEINYLNNYVYFQKWRDQNFQDIHLDLDPSLNSLEIEPMLLIPFIENAFKHSYDQDSSRKRWVKISLQNERNALVFEVSNSISRSNTQEEVPDEYMGIGIGNVQKRLNLLYQHKYQLQIEKDSNSFQIKLIIQLT
ncbi:MAG: putative two-component system sensor protein, no kinase domain [uncultured Aureispira sp.]|uniref:Putative two-component system sensor protein, no kinase domain n=1 Tax=uncultured Aureispira sp. TaxID=1331704 RepID=A0A6S6UEC7_9BACT|nr:MAG: putative two-component system sensor protein, no kinase domain [uncultured Aureispira sp.]